MPPLSNLHNGKAVAVPIQFELADYSLGGRAFVGRVRPAARRGRRHREAAFPPASCGGAAWPAERRVRPQRDGVTTTPRTRPESGDNSADLAGQPHHASAGQVRFVKGSGATSGLRSTSEPRPQRGIPHGFDDVAALFALEIVMKTALESQNPACAGF